MKNIFILGSTGTIGEKTLEVIEKSPKGTFDIVGLLAHGNIEKLASQAVKFQPKVVLLMDETQILGLKNLLANYGNIVVLGGMAGYRMFLQMNALDIAVMGVSGLCALKFFPDLLKKSLTLALANKESIVCGGPFILQLAKKYQTKIIPIDSEHNSLFQLLEKTSRSHIKKITLTASGGPFLGYSLEALRQVRPKEAIRHPNWKMGEKISVDSATLMNKGLEVIEASYLFDFCSKDIDVVIHPQSLIHSLIHFQDNSMMCHMSPPDMFFSIAHALFYPDYLENAREGLDLVRQGQLTFCAMDVNLSRCLSLSYKALDGGLVMTMALNIFNEIAVQRFLLGSLSFLDIANFIEKGLTHCGGYSMNTVKSLEDVMDLADEVSAYAENLEF